ncbi:MAG: hypothetical protein COT84_08500 [Chlamydiae bacterium CG10_big_fil_rev_8_21_14_0_10_35_9]|nr:MAG: hypothetical protein COT84_08500 [Chlamydiae bacterium CG10_big_fil_rev_8_21_14_0_10_35_9]
MFLLALFPFIIQAVAIGIDEAYFHYKRGLPKWERIGHPIDTLSVLFCMWMVLFASFNAYNLKLYIVFSVISCLMVTKDEFVHKHHCPASENWLHALLFIIHPLTLCSAGMIWAAHSSLSAPLWMKQVFDHPFLFNKFLYIQAIAMTVFLLYQIIFWNVLWKNKIVIKY